MDLHISHPMSSASVCSRREPSKIAQGKRSAALGKRQTEGIRPGGADRTFAPRIAESNDGAGLSHRPSGAGIPWSNGFTLGYFRLLPPGRTALNASLFLHLELLASQPCKHRRRSLSHGFPLHELPHSTELRRAQLQRNQS
jgi:hypothetical protein